MSVLQKKYDLAEVIGEDNYGIFRKAISKKDGNFFAIKLIHIKDIQVFFFKIL
jgi:hypothetical protein